jgi:hypothetical protein
MNWKRMTAVAAVVLGILAVTGIGVGRLFLDQWYRFEQVPMDPTAEIRTMITAKGFVPEVADAVHGLQLPEGVRYVYVAETHEQRTMLAATQPELEGRPERVLTSTLVENRLQGWTSVIKGPDGREYTVGVITTVPVLPDRVGVPAYLVGLAAAALAWLALAAWIYLDARGRGSAAALGWALLGLLAAPLALAVWLISRRAQGQDELTTLPVCPGCAADTVRGAAFCVRCGYGLLPACPGCRRLVEADWSYCATCGHNLSE